MPASNRDVIADILEGLGRMTYSQYKPGSYVHGRSHRLQAGAETLRWTDERFEFADCEIDAETLDQARAEAEQFGDTLRMSWGHAKSMIPLLASMVAEYEGQFGQVPAPGFDQMWKR